MEEQPPSMDERPAEAEPPHEREEPMLVPRRLVRESIREGLRDEALPIGRRLAEVKGLSNNALGHLERIEQTLDSERNARVDDLALLVQLLTEGWRSLNARLDRIEAALQQPRETNVVRLRDSA